MRVINGNRQKAEFDLLHAIWTDPTSRYKILMKRLYPAKPSLFLIKKSAIESVTPSVNVHVNSDHLSNPSDYLEI